MFFGLADIGPASEELFIDEWNRWSKSQSVDYLYCNWESSMGTSETKLSTHHCRVAWDSDKEDLRAHTVELAAQTVPASCAPEFGGNPAKADPEEMFVASLSSCHMLWFLRLAREERLRVTAYEDEAEGTMDGTRFTRVVLRPKVAFAGEVDAQTIESLHHGAHERCFIANSVNCPVEVEHPTN